jgi:hypothetical protein
MEGEGGIHECGRISSNVRSPLDPSGSSAVDLETVAADLGALFVTK